MKRWVIPSILHSMILLALKSETSLSFLWHPQYIPLFLENYWDVFMNFSISFFLSTYLFIYTHTPHTHWPITQAQTHTQKQKQILLPVWNTKEIKTRLKLIFSSPEALCFPQYEVCFGKTKQNYGLKNLVWVQLWLYHQWHSVGYVLKPLRNSVFTCMKWEYIWLPLLTPEKNKLSEVANFYTVVLQRQRRVNADGPMRRELKRNSKYKIYLKL